MNARDRITELALWLALVALVFATALVVVYVVVAGV